MRDWKSAAITFFIAVGLHAAILKGQTPPSAPPASLGEQAVKVILKHYTLVKDSKTGQAMPRNGAWSIGKAQPANCPASQPSCVEVFYRVPALSVQCSWVTALDPDGKDGTFLDESDDTERYWLREGTSLEGKALVNGRVEPHYPPIAQAAHVTGDVRMSAVIDQAGHFESLDYMSGPSMLRAISLDAAKRWSFLPMKVGARNVPYRIQIVFSFSGIGNFARVEVSP